METSLEKLTEKEKSFVHNYLTNNYNAGKACVSAGYSAASKYDTGYKLLRKPEIKAYIDWYLKESSLEKQELLKRLSDVAKNVGSEYILQNGNVDLESLLADGYGHLIKEVRRYKNGKIRVIFHDSAKALSDLARIYKLIDEGVSVMVNIDERIQAERELNEKVRQIREKLIPDNAEMSLQEYFAFFTKQ